MFLPEVINKIVTARWTRMHYNYGLENVMKQSMIVPIIAFFQLFVLIESFTCVGVVVHSLK